MGTFLQARRWLLLALFQSAVPRIQLDGMPPALSLKSVAVMVDVQTLATWTPHLRRQAFSPATAWAWAARLVPPRTTALTYQQVLTAQQILASS